MLANNTGKAVRELARQYPGKIGHLYGPGTQRGPVENFQYAFDNNRFGSFKNGTEWDEPKWISLMHWGKEKTTQPLWALVPDVVGDKQGTLLDWHKYRDTVSRFGYTLAFAVQDGMTALDVPSDAKVIFVGGTTKWKWATMRGWCADFPRVHVGRVNTYRLLYKCHDAGAESVDGTGWLRGCRRQWRGLIAYLSQSTGFSTRPVQFELF